MRIFLPATVADLSRYPSTPLTPPVAFAATRELAAALPDEDEEAVEFSAFLAAADTAVELLAEAASRGDAAQPRRVVIAVDVAAGGVRSDREHGHPGAVTVAEVAWADVVSVHLDDAEAAPDVERAARGDAPAAERLAERDLLWYDPSELSRIAVELA